MGARTFYAYSYASAQPEVRNAIAHRRCCARRRKCICGAEKTLNDDTRRMRKTRELTGIKCSNRRQLYRLLGIRRSAYEQSLCEFVVFALLFWPAIDAYLVSDGGIRMSFGMDLCKNNGRWRWLHWTMCNKLQPVTHGLNWRLPATGNGSILIRMGSEKIYGPRSSSRTFYLFNFAHYYSILTHFQTHRRIIDSVAL